MRKSRAGFSLAELMAVLAICGVIVGVGVPMVLGYYQNAQNTTGAQQIRALLNQARQLAIDQKDLVCVQVPTPTQMALYLNSTCTGPRWVSSTTDAVGNIALPPGLTVSASASPVFDYLGGHSSHDVHGDQHRDGIESDRLGRDVRPGYDSVGPAA